MRTQGLILMGLQAFERGSGSQVSLAAYEFEFFISEVCSRTGVCFDRGPSRCGPCLSFYSSQGKGSGYICDKKVKEEKMKEKNIKGGLGCGRLPSYPV
jgi:hypothetical protein